LVKINSPFLEHITNVDPIFFNLNTGDTILRSHRKIYDPLEFRYVGPLARFDHHDDVSVRGVSYAVPIVQSESEAFSSCLIQVFGDTGVISDSLGLNICWIKITRPLKLLDLRGNGALKVGCFTTISSIADRVISQSWSRYFYEHENLYTKIDGIIYPNAYNGMPAIVLYERAAGSLAYIEDLPLYHCSLRIKLLSAAMDLNLRIEREDGFGFENEVNDNKSESDNGNIDLVVTENEKNKNNNFNFLDRNIDLAIKNAQQTLLDQGISYVYSVDDRLIEHNPDGSEELLRYLDLDLVECFQNEIKRV
jgi:hypothetical protein